MNIHFSKYNIWKPSLRPQKKNNLFNNIARASRSFVHFFAATARLRRESAYFHVLWRAKKQDNDFLFLFLNFDAVISELHVSVRSERENRSPGVKNTAGQPTVPLLEPFKVIKKYVLFVNWKFFLHIFYISFIFSIYFILQSIYIILQIWRYYSYITLNWKFTCPCLKSTH